MSVITTGPRDPARAAWAGLKGLEVGGGSLHEDRAVGLLGAKAYNTQSDLVKWKSIQNQRTPTAVRPTSRQSRTVKKTRDV